MEHGVDFTVTLALSRNALKQDVPRKAALDTVIADACWPAARVHEIYPLVSAMCPRCNTEPETDLHTLWTCPCNANINDIAITSTQQYIERAVDGHNTHHRLWLRSSGP